MSHLSLIGMSGSGKSQWSMKLAEIGFRRFCCDDMIAARLAPELRQPDGSLMEMGGWMGFPYLAHYKEREAKYLAKEIEVLAEIAEEFENRLDELGENVVVDTTGSVIYAGELLISRLRRHTIFVHFSVPVEIQSQMLEAYTVTPRPVLWRNVFSRNPGESDAAALERCYGKLLASRETLYEKYADVTLDYTLRGREDFTVTDFLEAVAAGRKS